MRFHIIYPAWPRIPQQTPFTLPPLGPIQAAACAPDWVEVTVTDENVQPVDLEGDWDLVGLSLMLTCQIPRGLELVRQLRERGRTVVLGGLAAALHEAELASQADAIVVGEAEGLLQRLFADLRAGSLQPVYRHETFPDIAQVPLPRRDLLDKKRLYTYKGWELVDLVETSRGCRFNCAPCCTPFLGGLQHRKKSLELTLADIERCSRLLFLVDNSLEQDVAYQRELFSAMAGLGKRWISHPITPDPEVLRLAREAGCWYIYHAIYTISDKIRERIKLYHDHGIGVEGTILLGLDEHDPGFIRRFVDFLLEIDLDLAEFTVLTPFAHTRFEKELRAKGRIFDDDLGHYNAATVVFTPARMSAHALQEIFSEAWERFYSQQSQTIRMSRLFFDVLRKRR